MPDEKDDGKTTYADAKAFVDGIISTVSSIKGLDSEDLRKAHIVRTKSGTFDGGKGTYKFTQTRATLNVEVTHDLLPHCAIANGDRAYAAPKTTASITVRAHPYANYPGFGYIT